MKMDNQERNQQTIVRITEQGRDRELMWWWPTASPRVLSPDLIEELNSDYEYPKDSDADSEFNPGVCEVRRCKEDVWAACEECEILLSYDHFLEEVKACEHGKEKKKG